MNSVQSTVGELFFAKCRVLLNFNNWETVTRERMRELKNGRRYL